MSHEPDIGASSKDQGDRLLWLAAAVIVGMGLVWLVISAPWSSGSPAIDARLAADRARTTVAASAGTSTAEDPATRPATPEGGQSALGTSLDNPLRMAQLAYEAGMLIEPEDYSAWTLYSRVLEQDPDSGIARQGLEKVAADLLQRGGVALEQGRYDDTRATVERILAALPDHGGAISLAARLEATIPKPAPPPIIAAPAPRPEPEIQAARAAPVAPDVRPAVELPREEPRVDPIAAAHASFELAMRENRLLAPTNDSARHYVETMLRTQAEHELTRRDRDLLVTELLARSSQAIEALDTEAAQIWIDEAAGLAADQTAVAKARQALTDRLVVMESAKTLPASAFEVISYVAPEYPRLAESRELEGWVDVEFTVAADGATRDITVTDASHERYFRNEATAAVEQWRFEPRIFMDRPIDQRSFTRLRFVLAE